MPLDEIVGILNPASTIHFVSHHVDNYRNSGHRFRVACPQVFLDCAALFSEWVFLNINLLLDTHDNDAIESFHLA